MWTLDQTRQTVDRLTRTLIAVKNAPDFNQNQWGYKCGSPACTLGWATVVCPEVLQRNFMDNNSVPWLRRSRETIGPHAAKEAFHVSVAVANYMCLAAFGVSHRLQGSTAHRRICYAEYREPGKVGAIHRLELLIKRYRHRLAIYEFEAGEWGRQKPAHEIPVGREREELLTV